MDDNFSSIYKYLTEICGAVNVKRNAPLSRYTTFKVGGPADILVCAADARALRSVLEATADAGVPVYIMGRGSNLVFDDAGFRGIVVRLCEPGRRKTSALAEGSMTEGSLTPAEGSLKPAHRSSTHGSPLQTGGESSTGPVITDENSENATVYAYAGVMLSSLSAFACEHGLTGLEFASGIPGTVGGGVLMNAGAYGGELSQCVIKSTYLEIVRDGSGNAAKVREGVLEGDRQQFSYRHSAYQDNGFTVTGAYFLLKKGRSREEIAADMQELNRRRREKQPLELPSAGSAFKRPQGDFAGRLIEASGLKGYTVGGAQVSEKHAGFVVNRGGATAKDIRDVIDGVRARVFADSGVMLEPEIRFVGERG